MKNLTKLSKKAKIFCELSGYDADKVRKFIKTESFVLRRCETKNEMDYEGVDYTYPYIIYNPFNINIE